MEAAPTSRSTPKVPASSISWFRAWISPLLIETTSVRAPASSRAWRGCSSSTRSTPSAARIATRRWFSSPAISRSCHRRVEDDLGPALVTLVEVLVGLRRAVEGQLVADDERRLGLARGDEVAQLPVVLLDRRLAAADVLTLEPEHAVVEGELALLRQVVAGPGILGHEDPDVADLPGEAHGGDQPVHRQIGLLLPVGLVRLVADALAAVVRPQPHRLVENGLHRIDLRVVDGDRADRLGQLEPVGVPVDDHHLARPSDGRREGGHQPDRAGAVDDRLVAGCTPAISVAWYPVGKM